jgi:hypothetical protein
MVDFSKPKKILVEWTRVSRKHYNKEISLLVKNMTEMETVKPGDKDTWYYVWDSVILSPFLGMPENTEIIIQVPVKSFDRAWNACSFCSNGIPKGSPVKVRLKRIKKTLIEIEHLEIS